MREGETGHKRRATTVPASRSALRAGTRPSRQEDVLLSLQRKAGNAAVSEWLAGGEGADLPAGGRLRQPNLLPVQRCGPTACDCSPEERLAHEEGHVTSDGGLRVQRACGPPEIGKRDSCGKSAADFPADATPYLFDVNCDSWATGQQDRLRKDVKKGESVKVHGFASIEGNDQYNQYLSCARAEKAATFLINEVGAMVVEIHARGAVPGPRVPRRSVVIERVPTAKPPEPPKDVCGPDVDAQLTAVLAEVQSYFRGLSRWHKHRSCQQLISPWGGTMAWDIEQLYLPNTSWLRAPPFSSSSPPCGRPQAGAGQDVEDPGYCGNTVRVNGKCNLAGTVNYATFGIMMSECYDYYDDIPWYGALIKTQIPFFTESATKKWIWLYKRVLDPDDPGPPTEFAVAAYDGGPTARPSTENRAHCSAPCAATAKPPSFSFIWEPYQSR
jgi:hypothetical protein